MTNKSLPLFEGWSPFMVYSEYSSGKWSAARLLPQQQILIHPGSMALQFASSVFEGFKAYRVSKEMAHLFRPHDHHARFVNSCNRLCIPPPSYDLFFSCVESVISIAEVWDSTFASDWLYIRPVTIGLDHHIIPMISSKYAFYILVAPIRDFNPDTFDLLIEQKYSRATPGGLGSSKTAANYAHQYYPSFIANKFQCNGVVWVSPLDNQTIEEASTMNLFFRIGKKIITPPLKDTILPGITRDSVISILKQSGWEVLEKDVTVNCILNWIANKDLEEVFATSTALGIRAVDHLYINQIKHHTASNTQLSTNLNKTMKDFYASDKNHDINNWFVPINIGALKND